MAAIVQVRRLGGPGALAFAVLFVAPSAIAFLASLALAHHVRFSTSGLWFVYGVSIYVGCVGVVATAVLAVVKTLRHEISWLFATLIGVLVAIGIFLLWYASHIYKNPWAPNT